LGQNLKKEGHIFLKGLNGSRGAFKTKETGHGAVAIFVKGCLDCIAAKMFVTRHMPGVIKFTFVFLIAVICIFFKGRFVPAAI